MIATLPLAYAMLLPAMLMPPLPMLLAGFRRFHDFFLRFLCRFSFLLLLIIFALLPSMLSFACLLIC